ncbi:MAG: OST-HTH/LOTUS domain-containing protein [Thermostichus sp. HHBFW_bins_43]
MSVPRRLFEVSLLIAETLAQVRQDQPDLWRPDRQMWEPSSSAFVTKVAQFLERYEPSRGINRTTESLLQTLLQPTFFATKTFTRLMTCIGQVWQPEATELVGAILLDADNQTLTVDKEQWIQEVTDTSINYRFAFANWKARNTDVDLIKRGYHLLHAPAGDDMTDGLMIAFAGTIHQHYPEIEKVFICSNDRTFDVLAVTFSKYSVAYYRVIQHGHCLQVQNYQTGKNYEYKPPPTQEPSSTSQGADRAEEMVDIILELLRSQGKAAGEYTQLNLIATAYNTKYGHSISEGLRQRGQGSKLLTFITQQSNAFATKKSEDGQWKVSSKVTYRDPKSVEMVDIILELLRSQGKAAGEYVQLSLIGTAYNTKYGHSISEGLRQRGQGSKLLTFITQQSSTFAIRERKGGEWEVAYLHRN